MARSRVGLIAPALTRRVESVLARSDGLNLRMVPMKLVAAAEAFMAVPPSTFRGWGAVIHEVDRALWDAADSARDSILRRLAKHIRIWDKRLHSGMERGVENAVFARFDALRKTRCADIPAGAGACMWAYPEHCFVCLRPTELHFDARERVHNETGPATMWAGDYASYYWHGVRVPQHVVTRPDTITPAEIEKERNAEVRRVLIERYGESRYLANIRALPVQKDEYGEIYRKELPGDEPMVFVRVLNSTPETDGHRKPYFLRVPPNTRTVREAVAWTFGVRPEEYAPVRET